ncbi:MAG TPA: hypothetical protein VKT72_05510 [Candidatus Baltobacteraceae bacterium]|nr:hypothetical protein [Candidatus Baltobacteraceae bacterium]
MLTPQRRFLKTPWFAGGIAVAVAIALPNFVWQWQHQFPMLELLKAGQSGKNIIVGPLIYIVQQLLITGFFLAPIGIAGLMWLLRKENTRFLAYGYLLLIGAMILFRGKNYYPADVYPILIAAGAVAIEVWVGMPFVRTAITAAVVLVGLLLTPMTLPILPEQTFVAYTQALHLSARATETEAGRNEGALPVNWADMHGWPGLAQAVQRVYGSLPPDEHKRAVIFASNYGEAAAVQFFAPNVPVISAHNQYRLWGPGGSSGPVGSPLPQRIAGRSVTKAISRFRYAAASESRWRSYGLQSRLMND